MKVTLERKNQAYLFQAKGTSGVPVMIDNTSKEGAQGASPMELLLMGVGSCSAIDIISMLEKQNQKIDSYNIEVNATRKYIKQAKPFECMNVHIILKADIDPKKVLRAAALSFEKYCSVSITFESSVKIDYCITLNDTILNV